MSNYAINGSHLSSFGIIPGQQTDSNLAITGFWDMPARIGKIYQEWDDEPGIEPFVREDEIFFGGIDVHFKGFIEANDKDAVLNSFLSYLEEIDGFEELVPFSSDFGSMEVRVSEAVNATVITDKIALIDFIFRCPVVDLEGDVPPSDNNILEGIDGRTFETLGLMLLQHDPEYSRAATKNQNHIIYGKEGFQITKPGVKTYSLRFLINEPTVADFNNRIQGLKALLGSEGKRVLRLNDGLTREVFCPDGFKVTDITLETNRMIGIVTIPFTEINQLENYKVLADDSVFIGNEQGQKLSFIL